MLYLISSVCIFGCTLLKIFALFSYCVFVRTVLMTLRLIALKRVGEFQKDLKLGRGKQCYSNGDVYGRHCLLELLFNLAARFCLV